jgi:hypothetical protein
MKAPGGNRWTITLCFDTLNESQSPGAGNASDRITSALEGRNSLLLQVKSIKPVNSYKKEKVCNE